jgi:hypothetical protein
MSTNEKNITAAFFTPAASHEAALIVMLVGVETTRRRQNRWGAETSAPLSYTEILVSLGYHWHVLTLELGAAVVAQQACGAARALVAPMAMGIDS